MTSITLQIDRTKPGGEGRQQVTGRGEHSNGVSVTAN